MDAARHQFWVGFFLAGVGSVLFSAKAIFLAIALWQAYKSYRGELPKLSNAQRWQLLFLGFIGYYLASLLDFLGLQYITASLERLILFLAPTFVLLFSAIFLKKVILAKQWLALALAYFGVSLVFIQDLSLAGEGRLANLRQCMACR